MATLRQRLNQVEKLIKAKDKRIQLKVVIGGRTINRKWVDIPKEMIIAEQRKKEIQKPKPKEVKTEKPKLPEKKVEITYPEQIPSNVLPFRPSQEIDSLKDVFRDY